MADVVLNTVDKSGAPVLIENPGVCISVVLSGVDTPLVVIVSVVTTPLVAVLVKSVYVPSSSFVLKL